ncbi:MAG: hypothetical protein EZS28_030841 [Streblomastix strix]|uniref:Uncharacterized protein n=1 Tax=Streblomastix strix TaxID=222440 RepID=A0A5J4UTY7_9EUKA|nr:MAG: hypothetical protein EZS28_030841 [Streblomastix strix]
MEGASAMWKYGDAKEGLDRLYGRKREQGGIVGEEKFWEELKVEIIEGIVKERRIEEINRFSTSYMVPKAGNKWRKILDCSRLNRATADQHFQMEDVITVRQTIKQGNYVTQLDLEKSIAILLSNEVNIQSVQEEIQCKSSTTHGRPIDLITEKEITGERYGLDNLIHEGAGLEDITCQMQGYNNERVSIPWLQFEDLYNGNMHSSGKEKVIEIETEKMVRDYDDDQGGRSQEIRTAAGRVDLSEIAESRCVSAYSIDQSSENRSVEKTGKERKVEIESKNVGGFEMVGLDDQRKQSIEVCVKNTNIQSNNRCGDNRMGGGIEENGGGEGIGDESWRVEQDLELEVFKLTKNNRSAKVTKINEKLLSERDCNGCQHGQCGNGVEHQEIESEKADIVIAEKDPLAPGPPHLLSSRSVDLTKPDHSNPVLQLSLVLCPSLLSLVPQESS